MQPRRGGAPHTAFLLHLQLAIIIITPRPVVVRRETREAWSHNSFLKYCEPVLFANRRVVDAERVRSRSA